MTEIQKLSLAQAIKYLGRAGATFAILDADGVKHGALEIVDPKTIHRKRSPDAPPRGYYLETASALLGDLQPGGYKKIQIPERAESFKLFQAGVCNFLARKFGQGNYTTHKTRDGQLEVVVDAQPN